MIAIINDWWFKILNKEHLGVNNISPHYSVYFLMDNYELQYMWVGFDSLDGETDVTIDKESCISHPSVFYDTNVVVFFS